MTAAVQVAPEPNQMEQSMSTVTINSANFAALLRDVRQAASVDSVLPMVGGVLLHAGEGVLAATATDRYCALHGHFPVSGALPEPVWLTNEQISQVLAVVRPYTTKKRGGGSQVELTVADGKVIVRQIALDGLADVSVTFDHSSGKNFPNVTKIMETALADEPSAAPFNVDGRRLARFAQLAGVDREPMRLRSTGAGKPVVAQLRDNLVGILMQVRMSSENEQALDVRVYPLTVVDEVAAA